MTRPAIVIDSILPPLPRGTRWWGTAHSARRKYEWHAEPDGSTINVMAEREPGLMVCIKSPSHKRWFRQPVIDAIANMIPLVQVVKLTGKEWLAAVETVGRWERDNPWPGDADGITEAHWDWSRRHKVMEAKCALNAKLEANIEAIRAARAAGWLKTDEDRHAQAA